MILKSCHHVNQRQLLRILAILGHFWELLAILAMFGNPLHLLVSFCNIFWHRFATFVIFWQSMSTFINILHLLATCVNFWLFSSTFGHNWKHFLAKYCNFWQLLSCHHATMSSSILWQCFARGSRRGIIEEVKREPMNPVPALFWITSGRKHKIQMIFGRKNQND